MGLENVACNNILNGIRKSYDNAVELISEAEILRDNRKWSRAYTLCQLAIEELGKVPLLFQLLFDRIISPKIDYKEINKIFYDHKLKTEESIRGVIASLQVYKDKFGSEWVDNLIEKLEISISEVEELDNRKNKSIYVSIKENDFQSPNELIGEKEFDEIYGKTIFPKMAFRSLIVGLEENLNEVVRLISERES